MTEFYIDRKVTIWIRETYETVLSEQELKESIKDIIDNDIPDTFELIRTENLYDTIEELPVDENGGNSTIEAFLQTPIGPDNQIYTNSVL